MNSQTSHFSISALCFLTAALSVAVLHLCWLLASLQGYIHWCNPYWADCVSISKTGRNGLAYFIFKGGIIPAAVLQGLIWHLARHWLNSLHSNKGRYLPVLGWCACLALITYTLSLGHAGDTFRLLRRSGVVLYIALTYFCFVSLGTGLRSTRLSRAGEGLIYYSLSTLLVAVFSLILDAVMEDQYDRIENAFEWGLFMMLNLQLFWVAWLMRGSGLRFEDTTSSA